jgi:hypothetical protein
MGAISADEAAGGGLPAKVFCGGCSGTGGNFRSFGRGGEKAADGFSQTFDL